MSIKTGVGSDTWYITIEVEMENSTKEKMNDYFHTEGGKELLEKLHGGNHVNFTFPYNQKLYSLQHTPGSGVEHSAKVTHYKG